MHHVTHTVPAAIKVHLAPSQLPTSDKTKNSYIKLVACRYFTWLM